VRTKRKKKQTNEKGAETEGKIKEKENKMGGKRK
jgi:hypothetical protein